jgi:hypothetical protein
MSGRICIGPGHRRAYGDSNLLRLERHVNDLNCVLCILPLATCRVIHIASLACVTRRTRIVAERSLVRDDWRERNITLIPRIAIVIIIIIATTCSQNS